MRIVGIIGPYFSGGNRRLIDHNIADAQYVAIMLANHFSESKRVGFFVPHSHTARFEKLSTASESYYHALDDAIYDGSCTAFILLPKWENSSGSIRDRDRAFAQKRPLFKLTDYSDESIQKLFKELENWVYPGFI